MTIKDFVLIFMYQDSNKQYSIPCNEFLVLLVHLNCNEQSNYVTPNATAWASSPSYLIHKKTVSTLYYLYPYSDDRILQICSRYTPTPTFFHYIIVRKRFQGAVHLYKREHMFLLKILVNKVCRTLKSIKSLNKKLNY